MTPGQPCRRHSPNDLDFRFWLAFWAIAITNLAAALDATTLSVALPITASIGGGRTEAFWAGTSCLLACAAVLLFWASLSDAFGRRPMQLLTLAIFAAGSVVCVVAENYTVMIVGRTIQGLGGGGVLGLTTVLITDLVPLRDRDRFYALISVIWALGSTTGPIIGGACAVSGQWRWIFCLAGVGFFLKLTRRPGSLSSKLRRLDYFDSGFFHGVYYVVIDSGHLGRNPVCLGQLADACAVATCSTSIVYAGSFVHGLVLYTLVYYMPEYFQAVKGYSALVSGVAALPQTVTVEPSAIFVGAVVGRTGRYRWAIWVGWVLTTLGLGLLILLGVNTSVPAWIFLSIVSGLVMGLLFPSIALALQSSVPQVDVAMAATLVLFFRSFGQAVGVAIGSSILDNRLRIDLRDPAVANVLPPDLADVGAVPLYRASRPYPRTRPWPWP
ncbi:hypothetical protein DL767_008074 [Monosporascus sp. MG133]|nr:hypothetical protein DL767_008074 [Monosporascus sp. MG133]